MTRLLSLPALLTSAALTAATLAASTPLHNNNNKRAAISTDGRDIAGQTFDYIIAGGGLAGLVVANRLSEDPGVTVAVIEAGSSGLGDSSLTTPAANLYDSSVGTAKDWQYVTTAQQGLGGRTTPWPRGKVLGGSSAINGLYMVRHSASEQAAWASLAAGTSANASAVEQIWGWDNMLQGMKKSENFSPPTQNVQQSLGEGIAWNDSSHGTGGPIHTSWPAVTFDSVAAFVQAAAQVGVPFNPDPDSGNTTGAFVATSAINPSNWTRSFSRTGYLDPYVARPNLHVLTGHTVTKVNFDTSSGTTPPYRATSLSYAQSASDSVYNISATREVILSAGSIGTPFILQHSGVGDADLLKTAGVDQVIDLPGVGYHLQDHLATSVTFSPKASTAKPAAKLTGDAQQDSFVNSAIGYVGMQTLWGDYANNVSKQLQDSVDQAVATYNAPQQVKDGYRATYTKQVNDIFNSGVGPIELLFANSFGNIQVQCALQHPLSRGSVKITSNNPFDAPAIDAGYLSNSVDLELLTEGVKLARSVGQTSPLSDLLDSEITPGSGTSSDADWASYIASSAGTEYHPSCSCSMLPQELGGCVSPELLVYGTQNLRVIDASVPPLSVAAHLMTITYGLAEIGSDMIKAKWNNVTYPGGQPISAGSSGSTDNMGNASSGSGATGSNGGSSSAQGSSSGTLAHATAGALGLLTASLASLLAIAL